MSVLIFLVTALLACSSWAGVKVGDTDISSGVIVVGTTNITQGLESNSGENSGSVTVHNDVASANLSQWNDAVTNIVGGTLVTVDKSGDSYTINATRGAGGYTNYVYWTWDRTDNLGIGSRVQLGSQTNIPPGVYMGMSHLSLEDVAQGGELIEDLYLTVDGQRSVDEIRGAFIQARELFGNNKANEESSLATPMGWFKITSLTNEVKTSVQFQSDSGGDTDVNVNSYTILQKVGDL